MSDHLIIFLKNPIFKQINESKKSTKWTEFIDLLEHTSTITSKVDAHKHLYYDDYIENDSVFNDQSYSKKIHTSKNPKSQLTEAVKESFGQWAKKVVFMGADSMELTSKDINLVFKQLNHHHVVILPELNGGILLFGLTLFRSDIFDHFPWETEDDLLDTIINLQRNKNTYCVLEAKSAYD